MTRYALVFLSGFAAVLLGQQTTTINVPANQSWTRTGIYLNPGSSVHIEARGEIEAVPPEDNRPQFHHVPPAGRPERQSNKPQPNMPTLVLLVRIGDGPVLEAGARSDFRAGGQNGTGELLLGINDDYVADNSGSWTAQVTVNNTDSNLPQQRNNRRYQSNSNQNDAYANEPYRNGRDGNNRSQIDQSSPGRNTAGESALDSRAQRLGRNILGPAVGDVRGARDGVGLYREYRNGTIYWSPNAGAHAVLGPIRDEWLDRGGEAGELGYPTSDETQARDGSRLMRFQRGTITWNERTGIQVDRR